jgi:hypothetical protein
MAVPDCEERSSEGLKNKIDSMSRMILVRITIASIAAGGEEQDVVKVIRLPLKRLLVSGSILDFYK